jgi:hypothetical protein
MVGKNVQAIGLKLDFEDDSFILTFSIIIFVPIFYLQIMYWIYFCSTDISLVNYLIIQLLFFVLFAFLHILALTGP